MNLIREILDPEYATGFCAYGSKPRCYAVSLDFDGLGYLIAYLFETLKKYSAQGDFADVANALDDVRKMRVWLDTRGDQGAGTEITLIFPSITDDD